MSVAVIASVVRMSVVVIASVVRMSVAVIASVVRMSVAFQLLLGVTVVSSKMVPSKIIDKELPGHKFI